MQTNKQFLETCNSDYCISDNIGRPEAASPATGSMSRHVQEQNALVSEALDLSGSMDRAAE